MANNAQKAIIHVLKGKLKLPDEHYRDMLAAFGVSSSADDKFTFQKAKEFIQLLSKQCIDNGVEFKKNKRHSARGFISPGQSSMIIDMWFQVSRQPTTESKRLSLDKKQTKKTARWISLYSRNK
ncbi:MAG: hypothetical protein WC898_02240 [Candidatus Paceibacterota bacterium]|jgi:hypothetical protein